MPRLPCGSGNQGGVVLAYNRFLRIQVYTYYDLVLDAPPPRAAEPPPPPPAGETSGECELWRQARHAENFLRVDA